MGSSNSGGGNSAELKEFHGPLQRLILATLVEVDEPITAKRVRDRLAEDGTDRAQSTISTELNRLTEKGILERTQEEYPGGFRYLYTPVSEFENRYLADHLRAIQDVLGDDSLGPLCEMVRHQSKESEEDFSTGINCL